MKKKVLIGYASYGSGHKSVAQYIKNYIEDKNKYEVKIIDLSNYANGFGKLGVKLFNHANKNEFLYSFVYGIVNNKLLSKGNEKYCIKSFDNDTLRREFQDFNPDIVIATHYYVSYISSYYNSLKLINSKIMTVLTDFSHHEWWTSNHEKVDYYIVANDIVKSELIEHNVNEKKIYSFGIPVNRNSTLQIEEKDIVLKRYNLNGEKPVYLFFAGGSDGYDHVFSYFKALVNKKFPIDIIFICGKNKHLKAMCENYMLKNNIKNVVILGFSKDIFNLLNISNMVITKPGGSTLNECLEMKKPVILIPGVGGQEVYNARYMFRNHYAFKARGARSLVRKVKLSLSYPFIVNSMKNRLNKLSKRDSCKLIYELINKIL